MSSSLTITQARDEIYTMLKTAWDAMSDDYPLRFQGMAEADPSSQVTDHHPPAWARASIHHTDMGDDALGGRLFYRRGLLMVELFTPRFDGLSTLDTLSQVVISAFQGQKSPSGIWFREVTFTETDSDGVYATGQVRARFEYNEVRS